MYDCLRGIIFIICSSASAKSKKYFFCFVTNIIARGIVRAFVRYTAGRAARFTVSKQFNHRLSRLRIKDFNLEGRSVFFFGYYQWIFLSIAKTS